MRCVHAIATALVAVAACGGGAKQQQQPQPIEAAGPRPASVTDEMVATTDVVLEALAKLAIDLDGATDCATATATLRDHTPAMHAVAADAERIDKTWAAASEDAQRWFEATYRGKLAAANDKILRKAQACAGDPSFKAALDLVRTPH